MLKELNDLLNLVSEMIGETDGISSRTKFLSKTAVVHSLLMENGLLVSRYGNEKETCYNEKFDKVSKLCDEMLPILKEIKCEFEKLKDSEEKKVKSEEECLTEDVLGIRFLGRKTEE